MGGIVADNTFMPFGLAPMAPRKDYRILPQVQNRPGHPPPFPDLLARGVDPSMFGSRPDGSDKGPGYLGVLQRPDGGVSTEISAAFDDVANGQDIPLMVPTLNREEVQALLSTPSDDPNFYQKIPHTVFQKAIAFARQRQAAGLPLFARPTEYVEQNSRGSKR